MNTISISLLTRFLPLVLAGMLVSSVASLRAQDVPAPGDNGIYENADPSHDPPTRVARLSYVEGSVSFQPGGQGEWGAATRNRPVTIGDKIWSDNNSRAELQAGQASIHVSSMTALSFLNLDQQTTQMRLAEGSINFRVRELHEGEVYEVDTPNVSFTVTQAGAFRVDVNENGDGTRITAIRGEGQVSASGQTYTIHAAERGEFNGTDNVTYFVAAAPAPDDFDRWANERNLREDRSPSARYVSRDVPGYSDLDDYGTWDEVPEYGHVWYPTTVDVGWAPYSTGYWGWEDPWGWTWIDYEPWGFAPFHYGRWAFIGGRWGWCPGSYYGYPVYGPAFVGFFGGGWGFGFGASVGWFPLGFGEPFFPWFGCSRSFINVINVHNTTINNVNIINSTNIHNFNFVNAHNPAAVTVASRAAFRGGQAINRGAVHVTAASLQNARVASNPGVSPTRQSHFGAANLGAHVAAPPSSIQNRPVMARSTPAAAASHLPVRSINGVNNQPGRGGFNGGTPAIAQRPVIGRAAETAAAANNNRPSFAQGNRGSQGSPQSGRIQPGAAVQSNSEMSARQRELSLDKPQSHMRSAPSDSSLNRGANNSANGGSNRNWSAQGNTTDVGRAPAGLGSSNSPRNGGPQNAAPRASSPRTTAMSRSDRPPFASGSASSNSGYSVSPRSSAPSNRPDYANSNRGTARTYEPPQRSSGYSSDRPSQNSNRGYSQPPSYNSNANPSRGYSQPRSYNAPPRSSSPSYSQPRSYSGPRSYSAPTGPSRSYSAPSRSYSAPSHSSGGGGGSHSSGGSPHSSHANGSPHGRG